MTVRELINKLEDIEEKDNEVIFHTDSEGNDAFVDISIEIYDCTNEEDPEDAQYEDGTVLIYPSEWL